MSTPCICDLPVAKITAITAAILAWPDDKEKDILAIAKSAVPPARASEVNTVFNHLANNHDAPSLLAGPGRQVGDNCRTPEERAACEKTIADALIGRQTAARHDTPPSDEPADRSLVPPPELESTEDPTMRGPKPRY